VCSSPYTMSVEPGVHVLQGSGDGDDSGSSSWLPVPSNPSHDGGKPNDNGPSSSMWLMIAGVVGVTLVIIALIALVKHCKHNAAKRKQQSELNEVLAVETHQTKYGAQKDDSTW
jgi:hypothetical protein